MAAFSGPIPPPSLLNGYAEIDATFPNRLLKMAEKQEIHRHRLETWAVIGGTILSYFGVACALLIALAAFYVGYLLIMANHDVAGTIFGGGGLVSLVSAFIYGTKSRRQERLQKNADNRKLTRNR